MTCKDCLYYKFCKNQYGDTDYYDDEVITTDVENYCGKFEDKSQYIKLTCKIGDTVYFIENNIVKKWFVYLISCNEINRFLIYVKNNRNKIKHDLRVLKLNDIGKTVFLTKEEAEEKLKEMKLN